MTTESTSPLIPVTLLTGFLGSGKTTATIIKRMPMPMHLTAAIATHTIPRTITMT